MNSSSLTKAIERTAAFISTTSKDERKEYGQFFTSKSVAKFMTSLFDIEEKKDTIRVLDAGAGSGVLSIALLEEMRTRGITSHVELVCYENNEDILHVLSENLSSVTDVDFSYEIRGKNYITSQEFGAKTSLFDTGNHEEYDLIIGNPPYRKIGKNAPEAVHMKELCYGAPNLYFLFFAMGIHNLKWGGELVYIIPRSWTSGAYFERFRRYLLSQCVITNIHLFGSRDKVFDCEAVLQETMVIKVRKDRVSPGKIRVSSSETSDLSRVKYYDVDYNTIVGDDGYIYLVTNQEEADVLSTIRRFPYTPLTEGLRMKTGLVVEYRVSDALRKYPSKESHPLFYSQHIRDGRVIWPIGRDGEYICTTQKGYLQKNGYYLFVKRFTAKEEKRRLQCGIYSPTDLSKYDYISTQNNINYVHCPTREEVYGLYVLFNSTIYDRFYRIMNGSTQVNCTEINNMPIPSKETISKMGMELNDADLSQSRCDEILHRWIS